MTRSFFDVSSAALEKSALAAGMFPASRYKRPRVRQISALSFRSRIALQDRSPFEYLRHGTVRMPYMPQYPVPGSLRACLQAGAPPHRSNCRIIISFQSLLHALCPKRKLLLLHFPAFPQPARQKMHRPAMIHFCIFILIPPARMNGSSYITVSSSAEASDIAGQACTPEAFPHSE